MFNYRIVAVIKRELREKMMSKGFIIMTILMPVIMFSLIGLQTLMIQYKGDKDSAIEVITEESEFTEKCRGLFNDPEFSEDNKWTITFGTVSESNLEQYIESKKEDLLSGKLTGILFISQRALEDKQIRYYSKTPSKVTIYQQMGGPLNKLLIDEYFSGKAMTDEELNFARKPVGFDNLKVTREDKIKEQNYGNIVLAFAFALLLYVSLIMSGTMTMTAVIEEKSGRVIEVLLSSISSRELMTGKILGSSIMSMIQMIIWLSPMIVLLSTAWIALPDKWTVDIGYVHLLYFLVNFFLGLLIYQGLFATAGSIFNTMHEANSGVFPIFMLIIIPFFLSFSMINNPDNTVVAIASYVPFATIMIMPCRFTLVDMPVIYPVVSCIINILTLAVIFPVAGKIYRVGILKTGTKPTFREVIKWIRSPE